MPADDQEPAYAVDETDTIHARDGECDPTETAVWGERGVAKGLVRHGEALCPDCIGPEARYSLFMAASQQAAHDKRQALAQER